MIALLTRQLKGSVPVIFDLFIKSFVHRRHKTLKAYSSVGYIFDEWWPKATVGYELPADVDIPHVRPRPIDVYCDRGKD